jgi:hypothetical protein
LIVVFLAAIAFFFIVFFIVCLFSKEDTGVVRTMKGVWVKVFWIHSGHSQCYALQPTLGISSTVADLLASWYTGEQLADLQSVYKSTGAKPSESIRRAIDAYLSERKDQIRGGRKK